MSSEEQQETVNIGNDIISVQDLDALISQEQNRFAGLNDEVCTYSEGYIRQEVFSCLTCYEETKKLAGICYACSNTCHENHELVELYTRRNFCCDCGTTPQFKNECKLENIRTINKYNKYNDNFLNKWCTCMKPYPPEEGSPEADAQMLMCSVCENWFHDIHLKIPEDSGDHEELICKGCVTKLPFLLAYEKLEDVPDINESECKLNGREEVMKNEPKDLIFLKCKEFRDKLCKCVKCISMYEKHDCKFLTDYDESTVKYNNDRDSAAKTMPDAYTEFTDKVKNVYGADVAVNVSRELEIFKSIMKKEISKIGQNGVVDDNVVKRIISEAEEVRAKRPRLEDYNDVDV